MTLSRPVNDFAFIEQETIILERARRLIFRVSVSIRARLWLVYLLALWAEISTI